MRTYKDYYNWALRERNKWYYDQTYEWWRDDTEWVNKELAPVGDYLETVSLISIDDKNDTSVGENHTNIKNKEISILFDMLGQALIDWCNENGETDLWQFHLEIRRELDGLNDVYLYRNELKGMDAKTGCWYKIEDEDKIEKFNDCAGFLCDIVSEFISSNGKNMPCDWNALTFGLDSLDISCRYKQWVCSSDGYLCVGCVTDNDYIDLINCC